MKTTRWTLLKVALIALLALGLASDSIASVGEAQAMGMGLAIGAAITAVLQLAFWFFYDVITLKRGGWIIPSFGASPWAKVTGPDFHLGIIAITLLSMGMAKILAALHQGMPSLVLGGWLVAIGLFLRVWQATLQKLFRRRFVVPRAGSDTTVPPENPRQQGGWAPPGRP